MSARNCGQFLLEAVDAILRQSFDDLELLIVDERVRRQVIQRAEATAIRRAAMDAGMRTLRQDALEKLQAGRTTVEEVLRVTHDEEMDKEAEVRIAQASPSE